MRFFLGSLLIVLFAGSLSAQTNAGALTGTITDQQTAAMSGVRVTATNLANNVQQSSTTSNAGIYSLPGLEPGSYRLVAEISGFNKLIREPIQVVTSTTTNLDLEMTVGNTTVEVTVKTEAPLVQEANSTIAYSVNLKQIDELPLANQSALQVMSLLPGVVGEPGSEQASVTTGYVTPGGGLSVSGGRMGSTQYMADGVSNTSQFLGRISQSFSSDAIAEVSVQQNSYSAEYGRVGGGVVNMTTRSGTNQLHGTLFSFSQNDILNAAPYRNTFDKKGMVRYWRGGVDIGGPVFIPKLYDGRNRTFFFAGYEPLRQYTQISGFARVATELERQGDFSQSVYNTATNQKVYIFRQFDYNMSGTALTNNRIILPANTAYPQFPNSVIPKNLISPIGQRMLSLQPLPNMPLNALGQNYSVFRNVRNKDNRFLIKVDQIITSNNRMSFRISQVPTQGERAFMGGLIEQVPTDASTGTNLAFTDTHTWGGNKVNEFRAGFNRSSIVRREKDSQLAEDYFSQYGFPSILKNGFPTLSTGDSQVQSFGSSVGNYQIDNLYQVTDIVNYTRGKHNLKTGFEFQAPQQNIIDYANVGGSWSFNAGMTNIGAGNTGTVLGIPNAQTGFGLASLLLGFPNSVSMAPAVIPYQYRWKYYAAFLQDDYKVTRRLTLNLGVRYQIEVPRSEKHHNQGYFVPGNVTTSNGAQAGGYLQLNGLGGAINTLWPTRYNNWEPRIGFAYRLPEIIPGLSVLRGGYAITHTPTTGLFRIPIPDLSPRASALAANGSANGGYVQMDNFPLVLPNQGFNFPANGKVVDLANIQTVYNLNPNVTIPYVQQWNFGLGWQWGANYGLEMNYVGNKGTKLFGPSSLYNTINLPQYAQQFLAGANMTDRVPNPAGLTDQNGNIITVARQDLLRSIPTMTSIGDPLAQGYNSSYNALQLNFIKRFTHGLQFNINYTWMKSTDNSSCDGQFCNDNIQNWGVGFPQLRGGNRKLEHSISVYDIPSVFRFNYNWDLPVGRGKLFGRNIPGWANQFIGNWKLTGAGSASSGLPLQALLGNTAGFPDDVGQIRPNIVPGVDPINPGWRQNVNNPATQRAPYVNSLAVFTPPAFLNTGTATRVLDSIRMPATTTYNMAILKEFIIKDQTRFAFRAELYGALNHPFFQTNGNNFTVFQNLDYSKVSAANNFTPTVTSANINPGYADIGSNIGGTRRIQLGLKFYF
ncbi:MAG TPA: TonB-dependent receptor [Bryobacteraceae bacterium]|nr:TonB-dependent receptor [Bryobacteraceae bacterium]